MREAVFFKFNSYGYWAEEDIINASAVISARVGTPCAGLFWCEQAIEKYLKHAIVTSNKRVPALKHRLSSLAHVAKFSFASDAQELLFLLERVYYERYPTADDESPADPTWEDADAALELALHVRDWCRDIAQSCLVNP